MTVPDRMWVDPENEVAHPSPRSLSLTYTPYMPVDLYNEDVAKIRRDAIGDAVKIIMSLTEPGERAPASYFAAALERAK